MAKKLSDNPLLKVQFESLPSELLTTQALPLVDSIIDLAGSNKTGAIFIFETLIASLKPVLTNLKAKIEGHALFNKEHVGPLLENLEVGFKFADKAVEEAKMPTGAANFFPVQNAGSRAQRGGGCFERVFADLKQKSDSYKILLQQIAAEPRDRSLLAALMYQETLLRKQATEECEKPGSALALYREAKNLASGIPVVPVAAATGAAAITYATSRLPDAAGKALSGIAYVGGAGIGAAVYPAVSGAVATVNGVVNALKYVPGIGASRIPTIPFPTGLDPVSIGETFSSGIESMQRFLSKSGGEEVGFFVLLLLFFVLFVIMLVSGIGLRKVSDIRSFEFGNVLMRMRFDTSPTPLPGTALTGAAAGPALTGAAAGPALTGANVNANRARTFAQLLGGVPHPNVRPAGASALPAGATTRMIANGAAGAPATAPAPAPAGATGGPRVEEIEGGRRQCGSSTRSEGGRRRYRKQAQKKTRRSKHFRSNRKITRRH